MDRRIVTQILILSAFLAMVMAAAEVSAQTMPRPSVPGMSPQTQPKAAQNHSAIEGNPACQRIIGECKRLGFIQGQWKADNGLWKDCFDPVVKGGGNATRDGKPITVPVNPSDVQACRAVANHRKL